VAIDNKTGAVRAMVGGDDYNSAPFNLATQGQRQPGSAMKPFILARALSDGISPESSWSSRKLVIDVPHSTEKFTVNNYENAYAGVSSLGRALTYSDNSVFAQVGIKVGTRRVARLAERMGIRTPVSTNYAMTLGGLKEGVTPLDMAHAYETIASGGNLVYGTLSPGAGNGRSEAVPGPVGLASIKRRNGDEWEPVKLPGGGDAVNRKRLRRVLDPGVAGTLGSMMESVVNVGTGTRAQVAGYTVAGKTGTTEGYGDAWFVGWTERYTVAVWVGYPDRFQGMETEFNGEPVAGGTFPAEIFGSFMRAVLPQKVDVPPVTAPTTPGTTVPDAGATPAPSDDAGGTAGGDAAPAPATEPDPAPQPQTETAPPATGGDGTDGGGAAAPSG
jgi:penicillin-binding protein 1A